MTLALKILANFIIECDLIVVFLKISDRDCWFKNIKINFKYQEDKILDVWKIIIKKFFKLINIIGLLF